MILQYASRIPVVSALFKRERDRYRRLRGRIMDFARWYWTPPVGVETVFTSEKERIEGQLQMEALISVTDHDEISTLKSLQSPDTCRAVPTSLEWTVPVEGALLHLGVHNLPLELSTQVAKELSCCGPRGEEQRFAELLASLNDYPETLVVLNHPMSDLESIGMGRLKVSVTAFLERYGEGIHALEINGYRSWEENRTVIGLADRFGLPIVSGGDRHGRAPNALLNLTNAATFSEFVFEVRYDRVSEILVMPEYWRDPFLRRLESVADFLRYYPEYPRGQRRWTDRVFVELDEGAAVPLTAYWYKTVPLWVKWVMWLVCLVRNRHFKQALQIGLSLTNIAGRA